MGKKKAKKRHARAAESRADQLHRFLLADDDSDEEKKEVSSSSFSSSSSSLVSFEDPEPCPSAAFEQHYKGTAVVPSSEWRAFQRAMARPLPVTFVVDYASAAGVSVAERLRTLGHSIQGLAPMADSGMHGSIGTLGGKSSPSPSTSSHGDQPALCGAGRISGDGVDKRALRTSPRLRSLNELIVREMITGRSELDARTTHSLADRH